MKKEKIVYVIMCAAIDCITCGNNKSNTESIYTIYRSENKADKQVKKLNNNEKDLEYWVEPWSLGRN